MNLNRLIVLFSMIIQVNSLSYADGETSSENRFGRYTATAVEWIAVGSATTGMICSIADYSCFRTEHEITSLKDWDKYFAGQNALYTFISAIIVSGFSYYVLSDQMSTCRHITYAGLSVAGATLNAAGLAMLSDTLPDFDGKRDVAFGLVTSGCAVQIVVANLYGKAFRKALVDDERTRTWAEYFQSFWPTTRFQPQVDEETGEGLPRSGI